jgi:hypothetical protein
MLKGRSSQGPTELETTVFTILRAGETKRSHLETPYLYKNRLFLKKHH